MIKTKDDQRRDRYQIEMREKVVSIMHNRGESIKNWCDEWFFLKFINRIRRVCQMKKKQAIDSLIQSDWSSTRLLLQKGNDFGGIGNKREMDTDWSFSDKLKRKKTGSPKHKNHPIDSNPIDRVKQDLTKFIVNLFFFSLLKKMFKLSTFTGK